MIHEMKEMELAGMNVRPRQPAHPAYDLPVQLRRPAVEDQYWSRQITGRLYNPSGAAIRATKTRRHVLVVYFELAGHLQRLPRHRPMHVGQPRVPQGDHHDGGRPEVRHRGRRQLAAERHIQSATLNGKPLDKNYITYKDIADGGVMRLVMGPDPTGARHEARMRLLLAFQTRMNRSTTEIQKDMFKS